MKCPVLGELPAPENSQQGWPWTESGPALPETMPDGNSWPKVTVVTPSFQQGRFIEETIRSVLLQGYPNLDYIIMDGGSTDSSVAIIKKYQKWITYWESTSDRGQCHAINKGWDKASPGIWAWLNSDDTYFPGTISRAVRALKNHPHAKLVYASVAHIDEYSRHLYYYYGKPLPPGLKRMKFWEGWNIPQPTAFFYSHLVRDFGGLSEDFHLALDYELFNRFAGHVKFHWIDEIWASTRLHGDAKTGDWDRNKVHFFKETRLANKKNTGYFSYYYLRLLEFLSRLNPSTKLPAPVKRWFGLVQKPYHWGTVLQFGKMGNTGSYKKHGWSTAEEKETWSDGKQAVLRIPVSRLEAEAFKLDLEFSVFLVPGIITKQRIKILVNDHGLCFWEITSPVLQRKTVVIPATCIEKKQMIITFLLPDAVIPQQVGFNTDKRQLAVKVRSLRLDPVQEAGGQFSSVIPVGEMPKILFIRELFPWMGNHSAYDPLCRYVEEGDRFHVTSVYRTSKPVSSPLKNSNRFRKFSDSFPNPFYNKNSLEAELRALELVKTKKAEIIHITYGENNYGILGKLKKQTGVKLAVTFHQTPQWWEENVSAKEFVSLVDLVIVVSRSQLSYFEQLAPGRVFWVPLGIDCDFFSPAANNINNSDIGKNKEPRIIFSGHWMRDIQTLYAVVENLNRHQLKFQLDLLVPPYRRQDRFFHELKNFPQVNWFSGLTDEELRDLYRRASLLFIPYRDCTASCALLEAMACGLPVVSSRVGGIPDYTHPSFAELCSVGDVDGFTSAIIDLLGNPSQLHEKSISARNFVLENFAWHLITERTQQLYEKILPGT